MCERVKRERESEMEREREGESDAPARNDRAYQREEKRR